MIEISTRSAIELMERGLKTAKDMLANVEAGQPGVDSASRLNDEDARLALSERISWLEKALSGDVTGLVCESIEEAKSVHLPVGVPCTPAEYGILVSGIAVERRKADYSRKAVERGRATPDSVIGAYASHTAPRRIAALKAQLAIYFPVEGYRHPDGSTVVSIARGGDE